MRALARGTRAFDRIASERHLRKRTASYLHAGVHTQAYNFGPSLCAQACPGLGPGYIHIATSSLAHKSDLVRSRT